MQKLIKTLISNCPEDTIQFAKDLSKTIPYGSTIFMIGDLGSGKTTFTKGFAEGLGFSNEVQSPTYPILNVYSHSDNFIYHFVIGQHVSTYNQIWHNNMIKVFCIFISCK